MSVLLVVNTAPYGSEGPYNAFRLADALALRGEHVELFLMGDAVDRRTRRPGPARRARLARADARRPAGEGRRRQPAAAPAAPTRGLTEDQLVAHARVATIHDLAEATVRSDRVVSF